MVYTESTLGEDQKRELELAVGRTVPRSRVRGHNAKMQVIVLNAISYGDCEASLIIVSNSLIPRCNEIFRAGNYAN